MKLSLLLLALLVGLDGCGSEDRKLGTGTRIGGVRGNVTVSGQPAGDGLELKEGQLLEVAASARADLVLPGGADVHLYGAAKVEVGPVADDAATMVVRLLEGIGRFVLPPGARRRLEVQTPRSTTSAEGTEFVVTTGDSGDSIAVREGAVKVKARAGDASVRVGENEQLRVAADGVLGKPGAYDWTAADQRTLWDVGPVKTQKGSQ